MENWIRNVSKILFARNLKTHWKSTESFEDWGALLKMLKMYEQELSQWKHSKLIFI